ncbi:MAG: hypothetical protein QG622_3299 [Actinomycetota bacterium]|nr:hypothetical protein [Actinomycetota bacterium]
MATLELVPLRSKYPYTGHMTLRHTMPVIHPDIPFDLSLDGGDDVQDILDSLETTTTPKVAGAAQAGETAVRKGVQAR